MDRMAKIVIAMVLGGSAACRSDPVEASSDLPTTDTTDTSDTASPVDPCVPEDEIVADGIDQDCDGDDACYGDGDGDGYGDVIVGGSLGCTAPGESTRGGDCADDDPAIHPDATDICGLGDLDCDGVSAVGSWADDLGVAGAPADLQAALDDGAGTIYSLCAGSWPALSIRRDVTLVGVGGPTDVVVDAGGTGSVVSTAEAAAPISLTLEGLQLTGGDSPTFGGGIDGGGTSLLTVRDCDIHGNVAADGGGIFSAGVTLIEGTSIHDNVAGHGGGVVVRADLTMDLGSRVEGNEATTAAGVSVRDADVVLNDTLVLSNIASGGGGGIELMGTTSLSGGTVSANEASFGAGLRPRSTTVFAHTITDVAVIGNVSVRSGAGMSAFPAVAGLLTMVDVRFEANEAGIHGGGAYLEGPLGGEMDVDLTRVELVDNMALDEGGGLWGKDVVGVMRDITATGNTAWLSGGGVLLKSAHVTLDGVVITDNAAADPAYLPPAYPSGGGLAATGTAVVEVFGATLSSNTAAQGGGLLVDGPAAEVYVHSGTVDANVAQDVGGAGRVRRGLLASCDAVGVSWTGDVAWTDDIGVLQSDVPADGCFEIVAGSAAVSDSCACP